VAYNDAFDANCRHEEAFMSKGLLGALAVLIVTSATSTYAADMPAAPIYKSPPPAARSWTGLYLGGDVGLRVAGVDTSVTSATLTTFGGPPNNLLMPPLCASPGVFGVQPGPCPPNGASLNNTSFRAGLYAGYNWQFGAQWVAGFEEDWAWADRSKSLIGAFYPGGDAGLVPGLADASFSVRTTWDASARGRMGFLVTPDLLVYATGGAAWLHMEATSACPTDVGQACSPGAAVPSVITNSATRLGWTIGGGMEARLWANWFVRGEYRYSDYGTWANSDMRTFLLAATTLTVGYGVQLRTNTARFGLAYKIGD
jgi:outer membrane immunogenic protein